MGLKDVNLDELQCKALDFYDGGEFAYLKEDKVEAKVISYCFGEGGDSLLGFILKELSDADGDVNEAVDMLERAARQLLDLSVLLTEQ